MPDNIHQEARILIIDDEEMAAELLCRILEAEGYQHVERILDSRQAVAKFRSLNPDLVILDWMMPKVSGAKVLQQLRAVIAASDYRPILVVTALPHIATKQEALGRGATDFLNKPYDSSEIVLRVGNLLATRFLHLEIKQRNQELEQRVAERTAELQKANAALEKKSVQREEVAQQALREKEEWEQSFDAVPDHICLLDMQGKILRANRTMRERFEPIHGPLIGLDYRVCYCGTATPDPQPPCAEVLVKNRPVVWEGKLPTMEGWFWIAAYPLSENGVQWGAISVVRDMTARKEAEEALREAQEEVETRVEERTQELGLANSALSTASVVQKLVEEKLRLGEDKLKIAIAGADLGTWDFDLINQTIDASPRLKQMFGLSVASGSGFENFMGAVHPDDRERLRAELNRTIETGVPYEIEHRLVWPDGSVHWIAARASARRGPEGTVARVTGTAHDITERRAVEDALDEAKGRVQALLDHSPAVVFIKDLEGRFLNANKRMLELFGKTEAEILGQDTFCHAPDGIVDSLRENDRAVVAAGRAMSFEETVQFPSGQAHVFLTSKFPLRDRNDAIYAICGIAVDITDRKRAEAALGETQARYDAVIANVPGMVYRLVRRPDLSVVYQYASEGCRQLLGVDPSYFGEETDPLGSLVHPDDRKGFDRLVEEAFTMDADWSWEGRVQLSSGEIKWIEGAARSSKQPDGNAVWDGLLVDVTERKRAEDALRESDARYHRVAANAPGMVYQFRRRADGAMEFLFVSDGARELFGLEPAEIEADANVLVSRIAAADLDTFVQSVEASRTSLQDWNWEGRFLRISGEEVWIQGALRPALRPNGDVVWDGVLIDITEQKRADALLAATETRYRQIVETAQEGVWVIDAWGKTVFVNPKMAAMLGVSVLEMTGRSMYDFMDAEARQFAEESMKRGSEGIAEQHGFRFRRGDGSPLWALVATNPLPSLEGEFGGALAMVTDITERKRAEEQLQDAARENTQLASAIANLTSGVVISDPSLPDNPVIFANAAFYSLTGYSPGEVLDRNCRFLQGPETDPATVQEIREAIAARRIFQGDILNYRKDGSTFWDELTITPVFDQVGTLLNFVGLQSDITARRETALALQRAKAEAERANAAKSEFLSRMSHELRTPLNAILGFAQLAELDVETADERENIEQISRAGGRLLQLINEILDISRIESGHMSLALQAMPLGVAVTSAIALVRPLAAERKVTLADVSCWQFVLADEQRLQQVLLNLLSNAIKYNREGGSVTVSCQETTADRLRITIEDTGIGIAEMDVAQLFQPFQRLPSGESNVEGIGLGLAISQRLVGLMGGRIGVETEPDVGSRFWFELPLAPEPVEQLEEVPPPTALLQQADGIAQTLLYIEDNAANLKLVQRIIAQRPAIRMIAAQQGSLGLEMARQHQPDLILLDLHLPDMNGDQVLVWLRSEPRTAHIPVIMISADAIGGEIERLKELGASAYITKPFEVPKLLQALDDTLARQATTAIP